MRGLTLALLAGMVTGPANKSQTFHHENVLGTSLELKVSAPIPGEATKAEAAVLAEIDRLAKILSGYDPASEFSRWAKTRNTAVKVSPELFEVLQLWDQWRQQTGGALNPGAEAVGGLWKQAAKDQRAPSVSDMAMAAQRAGQIHWKLDAAARTAIRLGDAPLMLNSFTKGWILERAAQAAIQRSSIDGLLLNIGGDIVVRGLPNESVAVADPRNSAENAAALGRVPVRDHQAIATSGNYRRGFQIGNQWYSHIVDPRTGKPVDRIASATVIAPDAVTAGALATAFNVLTPEESQRLAARYPKAEYLLISRDGSKWSSPGWTLLPAAQQGAPKTSAAKVAATLIDVQLTFELARIDGGRYRRPYVAVWVEDKDHFPVRTIALWYEKPRWLPDLKAWTRAERLRKMAEGAELPASLSSATRSPGKYTLEWDGKDQEGKPVKAGKYTLMLEVAREHGTYQLMRQDIDVPGAAKQFPLPANEEVASAMVEIKKAN